MTDFHIAGGRVWKNEPDRALKFLAQAEKLLQGRFQTADIDRNLNCGNRLECNIHTRFERSRTEAAAGAE